MRLIALSCFLLAACSNLNATLKAAYDTTDSYTKSTVQLAQSGAISKQEAASQDVVLHGIKSALDSAAVVVAKCPQPPTSSNCSAGQVAIAAGQSGLASYLTWLTSKGVKQ